MNPAETLQKLFNTKVQRRKNWKWQVGKGLEEKIRSPEVG
jgi:hypothetical protein